MKVARGIGIGLLVGVAVVGMLVVAFFAGRQTAPTPATSPMPAMAAPAAPPPSPVAPPPEPATPAPLTPTQAATSELVAETLRLRAMSPEDRAAALASWGPMGEPSFASLERGVDAHVGERSCYRGTVEEIHDVQSGSELRLALRAYGQDVIYVFVGDRPADDVVAHTRVTVCGIHMGAYSYVSQAGWNITLPLLGAVSVERRR